MTKAADKTIISAAILSVNDGILTNFGFVLGVAGTNLDQKSLS
jgi:hypothetical protein